MDTTLVPPTGWELLDNYEILNPPWMLLNMALTAARPVTATQDATAGWQSSLWEGANYYGFALVVTITSE